MEIHDSKQDKCKLDMTEKPSVRLSVCLSDHHTDISAVSALIETGLARNES